VELKSLLKCNHKNIVKLYGAFLEEGILHFVLEYMDMGSVKKLLKELKTIGEAPLGIIAMQVSKANI